MTILITLLRGINVSGQKKIPMADLRALLESDPLAFKNVKTYIQSGNVIFEHDKNELSDLPARISAAIEQQFGFSVEIMLYTRDDWRDIVTANPYAKDDTKAAKALHVTLLSETPSEQSLSALSEIETRGDEYTIIGKVIYLHCPNGYGRTKLTNTFWEKKLKLSATTRNWNTCNKLLALADSD